MYYAGLPFVLKLLKFDSCPEIVLKSAIVLKFYSFGQNVLIWTFVMLCYTFFTSHDYVNVADVECQVMFSLVTLYCFMCNIALVIFLGLQYWSASMINIYEHRKTCIFCVLSLMQPTSVLKFSKNLVLKFHFLLLGALTMSVTCFNLHNLHVSA